MVSRYFPFKNKVYSTKKLIDLTGIKTILLYITLPLVLSNGHSNFT